MGKVGMSGDSGNSELAPLARLFGSKGKEVICNAEITDKLGSFVTVQIPLLRRSI